MLTRVSVDGDNQPSKQFQTECLLLLGPIYLKISWVYFFSINIHIHKWMNFSFRLYFQGKSESRKNNKWLKHLFGIMIIKLNHVVSLGGPYLCKKTTQEKNTSFIPDKEAQFVIVWTIYLLYNFSVLKYAVSVDVFLLIYYQFWSPVLRLLFLYIEFFSFFSLV